MVRNTPILERRFFSAGQTIIEQGEPGDFAYLIQSGRAKVIAEKDGVSVDLAILEAGDIFGETALLFDEPRTAKVQALDDTTVIIITRQLLEEKVKKSDPTIRAIVRMMTERMKMANDIRLEQAATDVDNIIRALRRMFVNLLEALPEDDRTQFRHEFAPVLTNLIEIIESYGHKLK